MAITVHEDADHAKCIRVAEPATKNRFIEEMLNPAELEKLIRDSYANYVIQTAVSYILWITLEIDY